MSAVQWEGGADNALLLRLEEAYRQTDCLFASLSADELRLRPIAHRHRLLFYLGHLEAFDWNLLAPVLGLEPFDARSDALFAFGIDPDGSRLPSESVSAWPPLESIEAYAAESRRRLGASLASSAHEKLPQLLNVAIEHRLMHAETLAYLLNRLPRCGEPADLAKFRESRGTGICGVRATEAGGLVHIPPGSTRLGMSKHEGRFGWDSGSRRTTPRPTGLMSPREGSSSALVWLRRDLRLRDNPALHHACSTANRVVLVYLLTDEDTGSSRESQWPNGAATRWWLHHSLVSLAADASKAGLQLVVRRAATALHGLRRLIEETGATEVCRNRLYEPGAQSLDAKIETALRKEGIAVHTFNGALLFEPEDIRTGKGGPFKVFTPFWRKCGERLHEVGSPLPAPRRATRSRRGARRIESLTVAALELLPRIPWDDGLQEEWQPGEAGALRRLRRFKSRGVSGYVRERDLPGLRGTSRLSPHLHFGEIGPRQVLAALTQRPLRRGAHPDRTQAGSYIRQLGWREFAHHLLHHFPHTERRPLDPKFARYPWARNRKHLRAWQQGLTGYPLVDAGMRELWRTGWMHNRVRMTAASFLTKNLRHHWLEGARWFWDTLVDADLPNNTLGWQWVAGCGADAAPYFRVFNPVLQTKRFDPDRAYLRRWIPELAALPDRWIHRPFEAPAEVLETAGVRLGKDYPRPIVGLAESRDAALRGYHQIRRSTPGAVLR